MLIFSDSHGDSERMKYIIDEVHPDAEYVLHLGDFDRDIEELAPLWQRKTFVSITGNCDRYFRYVPASELTRTLDIGGLRIFMCHGDRQGVKSTGDAVLSVIAAEKRAEIALYGHTHVASLRFVRVAGNEGDAVAFDDSSLDAEAPFLRYGECVRYVRSRRGEGILILNPGSMSSPRGSAIFRICRVTLP